MTILAAFIASQISPGWTARYFAVILGPVVLLARRARSRARRLGIARSSRSSSSCAATTVKNDKENAREITAGCAAYLHPGELIISTHPEQVPVLRYYLGAGLPLGDTLGPVKPIRRSSTGVTPSTG